MQLAEAVGYLSQLVRHGAEIIDRHDRRGQKHRLILPLVKEVEQ